MFELDLDLSQAYTSYSDILQLTVQIEPPQNQLLINSKALYFNQTAQFLQTTWLENLALHWSYQENQYLNIYVSTNALWVGLFNYKGSVNILTNLQAGSLNVVYKSAGFPNQL